MLHLIFSLPHAWGGITCSVRFLRSLIPENSSGGSLSAPSTIRVRQADLASAALRLNLWCPTASFTASGTGYNPLPVRFRQADLDRDD